VFSNNPDPCTGGAIQTRVDTYADWIQDTLDADTADCRVDADICFCPQACNPYGGCDNEQCKIYTCDDVLKCFKDCDHEPACQARCYIRIMPDALELLHNYYWCRMQECYNSNDPDSCADQHCSKYREQCQDTPVGTDTCTDMHTCVAMCDWTEPSCFSDCYFQGSTDAQNKYVEMWDCFEKSCSTTPLFNFEKDCGWQHCAYELEVCVEPDFCSMLGGDCSFGNACWFTPTNKPHCFTSDNIQEGAACPQIPLHTRPCADGMQCVMVGGNARCHRVCLHNSHCRTGEICEESAIDGLPEYGYCICQDDDQDGHCSLDDCDDNNPDIHPDKGERCWDEIDNNCNGETDEGCLSEDDTDGAKGSIPATNENSGCQTGRSAGTTIPLLLILLAMLAILPRKSTDPTQT
jgi:hypothetical protein